MTDFNLDIAKELFSSEKQFPVDFNLAWEWLEYSRKDSAKRAFEKMGFVENLDYQALHTKAEQLYEVVSKEEISLTVDCFKMWAMMSNTEKGKQVRLYFLECEKIAKQATKAQAEPQPKPRELPPIRDSVDYTNAAKTINTLKGQIPAALIQLLLDKMGDELCTDKTKQLVEEVKIRLVGCAQKAEEMGLPVNEKNRGNLGKFCKSAGLTAYPQEERLCNGQMRKINMYQDNIELEETIKAYFR